MARFPQTHSWFGKRYNLERGNMTKTQAYHLAAMLRDKSRYMRARVLMIEGPERKVYGVYSRYGDER